MFSVLYLQLLLQGQSNDVLYFFLPFKRPTAATSIKGSTLTSMVLHFPLLPYTELALCSCNTLPDDVIWRRSPTKTTKFLV